MTLDDRPPRDNGNLCLSRTLRRLGDDFDRRRSAPAWSFDTSSPTLAAILSIADCSSAGRPINSPPLSSPGLAAPVVDFDRLRIDRHRLRGRVLVEDLLQVRRQRVVPFLADLDDSEDRRLAGLGHVFCHVRKCNGLKTVMCGNRAVDALSCSAGSTSPSVIATGVAPSRLIATLWNGEAKIRIFLPLKSAR